jgi:hypothetical protein
MSRICIVYPPAFTISSCRFHCRGGTVGAIGTPQKRPFGSGQKRSDLGSKLSNLRDLPSGLGSKRAFLLSELASLGSKLGFLGKTHRSCAVSGRPGEETVIAAPCRGGTLDAKCGRLASPTRIRNSFILISLSQSQDVNKISRICIGYPPPFTISSCRFAPSRFDSSTIDPSEFA